MPQIMHQDIADWLKDQHITIQPSPTTPPTDLPSTDTPSPNPTSLPKNYGVDAGVQYPNTNSNPLPSPPPYAPTGPNSGSQPSDQSNQPNMMSKLQDVLSNPPLKVDFPPSKLRRTGAAIAGGLTGWAGGPKVGADTARSITDQPYQDTYQDWLTKSNALEKGVGLETSRIGSQFRGYGGLAQVMNAQNRGNVDLQGKLASAREDAKKSPLQKQYEFYLDQLPEGQEPISVLDFEKQAKGGTGIERISGQAINAQDAVDRAKKGEQFKDRAGNIIDTGSLKPTEELALISGGTPGDQRYARSSQRFKSDTLGNMRYIYPSLGGPGQWVAEGEARTPTTHEIQTVSPTGEQTATKLQTITSTPGPVITNAPGAPQVTSPQVTPPASNIQPPRVTAPNAPNAPNSPIPQVNNPVASQVPKAPLPSPQAGSGSRSLGPNFSEAEVRRQTGKTAPISTAFSQLVGVQGNPDVKSLKDYASIADNKDSRDRVGAVTRLVLDNMVEGGGGESIGLSAMGAGASASLGGLFSWLKNSTGMTYGIAKSQAKAIDSAMSKLSPEEHDYITQLFSSFGAMGGFRQALGLPSSRYGLETVKREVPAIGYNDVNDSRTFNNKLAKMGTEVLEGIKHSSISDYFLPEKQYWENETNKLIQAGRTEPSGENRYTIKKKNP